jgi:hypothetical protein
MIISDLLLSSFVPVIIYPNAETFKSKIYSDNKDKAGIYQWTHISTGRKYIGSSNNLSKRLSTYFSIANLGKKKSVYIHNALLKYSYSAFSLSILEYINITNLSKAESRKF